MGFIKIVVKYFLFAPTLFGVRALIKPNKPWRLPTLFFASPVNFLGKEFLSLLSCCYCWWFWCLCWSFPTAIKLFRLFCPECVLTHLLRQVLLAQNSDASVCCKMTEKYQPLCSIGLFNISQKNVLSVCRIVSVALLYANVLGFWLQMTKARMIFFRPSL